MTTPRPDTQIPSTAPAPQAPTPGPARPAPAPGLTAPAPQAPAGPASSSAPPDGRTRYANGERRRADLARGRRHEVAFAEQGFQRLSVRQIAAAIGTSHTMLPPPLRLQGRAAGSRPDPPRGDGAPRSERWRWPSGACSTACRTSWRTMPASAASSKPRRHAARGGREPPARGPRLHDRLLGERFLAAVRTAVVRDQAAGRIRADVDPDLTARRISPPSSRASRCAGSTTRPWTWPRWWVPTPTS